ncbi:MAG: DUF1553 domain-containing protein [Planctomycetes bacterium]|nr:DUF1553 domain-containing protein [Planctomycetota bacterium]
MRPGMLVRKIGPPPTDRTKTLSRGLLMYLNRCTWITALVVYGCLVGGSIARAADPGDRITFNQDIRPILSENCFQCHGPDSHQRKKDLRFDVRDVAIGEREGGPAIVPGHPEKSQMIRKISATDPKDHMPPASTHKQLTPKQIETLTQWIADGAEYEKHWAFIAPVEPAMPKISDPAWVRNPIDTFVLARLDKNGLKHSPEADKLTLIRRVTFDLTGLPPTLAEIDAFMADESPEAYEKLVDRLLASPHYGQHMARYWLDAARYGDTHGLHLDNYREDYPYRDYVVRSFNANKHFDRFILEQIAGDLLENPTTDDLIGSGFNRLHVTTNEGGAIKEEFYVRNVLDRVSTTGTVFLGLTVGCAECHDHKFDPITQKDFYSMFAFFNNLDADPMDGNRKDHAPVIRVASEQQQRDMDALNKQAADLDAKIDAEVAKIDYTDPFEKSLPADLKYNHIVWVDDELPRNANVQGDGLVWVEGPDHPVHSGKRSMQRTSQGNQQHFFDNCDEKIHVGPGDKLFAWVYLDPKNPPKEIMLQYHTGEWLHRAYWGENLIPYGKDNSTERAHMGKLPPTGQWVKLEVPAGKMGLKRGDVIQGMAFTQYDGTAYWDEAGIDTTASQEPTDFAWIDDDAPSGAKLAGIGASWQWGGAKDQPVFSGLRSLHRAMGDSVNQDYFTGASPLVLSDGDKLFAYVYLDPKDPPKGVQLQFNNGNWEHRVRWGEGVYAPGRNGAADFVAGPLPQTGKWVRLQVDLDKVGLKPGDKLNGWAFSQNGGSVYWDKAGINTFFAPDDRFRTSQLVWEGQLGDDANVPEDIRKIIKMPRDKRSADQASDVKAYYLRFVYSGSQQIVDPLNDQIAELNKQVKAIEAATPTMPVMKERATPREAWVLKRGQYDQHGDKVERVTPAALPPMASDLPRNRLGFAKWLIDPAQPLTARVTVNRFWQQCFGVGLVKTSEDFGSQGEPPSHPLLLDYLAVHFEQSGWDVKALMKMIVMSSTYRQASNTRPELLERDPENRLLAHGPRFRLDAEEIRDQALMVSGLLVDDFEGPSVKVPQPAGLWEAVGYTSSNTARFKADTGEKIYRRSLYTFWKRTSPPPQMVTFDAPSRESCITRRERTNTPLQALIMMNEEQMVESARGLAQRAMTEGGASDDQRATYIVRMLTGRPPAEADMKIVLDAHKDFLAEFKRDTSAARSLIEYGQTKPNAQLDPSELAAWTMVANTVFSFDASMNKN